MAMGMGKTRELGYESATPVDIGLGPEATLGYSLKQHGPWATGKTRELGCESATPVDIGLGLEATLGYSLN